jgi:peptide deformylase
MILPIIAYGDAVLRKRAEDVPKDYPKLQELIDNMFETMYNASGVGLAAPQVGLSLRLLVVDGEPFAEDDEVAGELKGAFINPVIKKMEGELWKMNEGCLSLPRIREDVSRHETIEMEYYDSSWNKHTKTFSGIAARILLHEYDHIEGLLIIDRISPLRKRLIEKKLIDISRGNINVEYKMKFPIKK